MQLASLARAPTAPDLHSEPPPLAGCAGVWSGRLVPSGSAGADDLGPVGASSILAG